MIDDDDDDDTQVYKRPWVGLTDEERYALHMQYLRVSDLDGYSIHGGHHFARAIETRLREKNT